MADKVKMSRENAEDEKDNELSMVDVLEEEQQLEADANAVLGGSDDKNCTYPLGYVDRQALYACATCSTEKSEAGGVCLACSLHCHEGHDLYELYTKRSFKCDCGNSKYPEFSCNLVPDKEDVNKDNQYNQNFRGLYCSCSRPYPDPEDDVDDEMIQCVICEDWHHGRHLGVDLPDNGFHEMICPGCMKKCDFLWSYTVLSKELKVSSPVKGSGDVQVEVVSSESASTAETSETSIVTSTTSSATDASETSSQTKLEEKASTSDEPKSGTSKEESPTKSKAKTDCDNSDTCVLKELQTREIVRREGASFWPTRWRRKLCRCVPCTEMYSSLKVAYLTDEADSVQSYEDRGKAKQTSSQFATGMSALSGMDRVQLGEMMHGYNDLKDSLRDYLKKFAENKKVVREEDIREFFTQMEARKRRKTGGYVPHFCK